MGNPDNLAFLQALLQLGWPAIVLIECIILWRDNQELRNRLFDVLQKREAIAQAEDATIRAENS